MGWQPGAGIGARRHGNQEPLASQLDLKLDKKGLGLGAPADATSSAASSAVDIKLPVAYLNDICLEQSWRFPTYELIHESGPAHAKEFRYKIQLNGQEFCGEPSSTKKLAKGSAARICLQELRLIS